MKNKQKDVLDFIEKYMLKNYASPSYQDICDGVGIKSKANVHYIIKDLEYLGFIERTSGKHRSFKLPKKYNAMKLKRENQQLKELLKECREVSLDYGNHSGNYELYDRIDNAIGEK